MKFEKAKVTIINLGDQDILTCSGEIKGCNWTYPSCNGWNQPKTQTKQKGYGGWGWFGWFHWWF